MSELASLTYGRRDPALLINEIAPGLVGMGS